VIRCITLDELLILHQYVIEQSGGSAGVRDMAAIESALAQPRMAFGGQELYASLADKAAALAFSLVQNHPFIDGNKRIGHAALETFLILNGYELSTPVDEAEQIVLKLAAGELSREEWTSWVRNHIVELKS
jgi:death-on-curing protein